jgi:hypothetical protein
MRRRPGFDEVMIINPYDPGQEAPQGVRPMMGYYAEPADEFAEDPYGYYGYHDDMDDFSEDEMGYYDEYPEMVGWGGLGYEDFEPMGYYAAEDDPYGYYADDAFDDYYDDYYDAYDPLAYYAEDEYEPVGYYAEEDPYEPYGRYGEDPYELMGWYGEDPYELYGEDPDGLDDYWDYEPSISGYVRETAPTFNAGCPAPINVHGYGEDDELEGYVRPSTVNAACAKLTAQPGPRRSEPMTFRPLW